MAIDPNKLTSMKIDIPKDAIAPGKVYFVNNSTIGPEGMATASNDNSGESQLEPLSTIAGAVTKAAASRGDIVYVMPGHAETATAAITLSKAGMRFIGVGHGSLTPTITGNFAGDAVNITGANVWFENFRFGAPLTDAQTSFINVSGANCTIKKIRGIGSVATENVVDCITLASGANYCTIDGVEFFNTVVAVNSFLSIEAAVARLIVKNFFAFGDVAGSGIIDAATATQIYLENVRIGTVGTTKAAATLDSNPTGMVVNCSFAGTSATLADNAALGTGLRLFDVKVLEETDGTAQGALIPAVDADA